MVSELENVPKLEIVPELDKCSKPSEKTMSMIKEIAPEAGNQSDNIEVEKKKLHKKRKSLVSKILRYLHLFAFEFV